MTSKLLFSTAVCIMAALPVQAAENCKLQKYSELPVSMVGTRPIVSGTINGMPATFLLDSGAFFNSLTSQGAKKYQVKLSPAPPGYYIRGASGNENVSLGNAKDFTLTGFFGGQVIHDVKFMVMATFTERDGAAGIIGQNTFGHDDTEYDLANGVVRLFRSKDCGNRSLAYWQGSATAADLTIDDRNLESPHIVGSALLNGKKIRVMLDTGANRSFLTLRAATRVGVKLDDDEIKAAGISKGVGKKVLETSLARFDELNIGGEVIKNARLLVNDMDIPVNGGADLLLGADFFLSHRVYVAENQHKIYFTYNGGRVFDLGAPKTPTAAAVADAPNTEGAAAAIVTASSLSAAEYRRRGAASAGRHDFQSAIADFDQAITLEPSNAENYYERALAKRENRQGLPAIRDLDEALKLKPDYIPALVQRGSMRLAMNNQSGARTDFDAAAALAPSDSEMQLGIAQTYMSTRRFDEAVVELDKWIAAFPKDARLPAALYDRCWSRALLGKELDLALADCNGAIKSGSKSSQVLEGRALVFLRRGDLDKSINDYKSSLKLQPKGATALYGLGVAQIKKGAKSEGSKNIEAAVAINPAIAELYKRLDLAP